MTIQPLKPLAILACVLFSTWALAVNTHGILNEASLQGSKNLDAISIKPGDLMIDGNHVNVLGEQDEAVSSLCTDTGVTLTAATTAFYLYYAYDTTQTTANGWYISLTTPTADGHPSVALAGSKNYAACTFTGTHAVFVGSYVTDAGGHVVPFYRSGDQVVWTRAIDGGAENRPGLELYCVPTNGCCVNTAASCPPGGGYPSNVTVDFSTATNVVGVVPATATAVLVDIIAFGVLDSASEYGYILNKTFPTIATSTSPNCSYNSQFVVTYDQLGNEAPALKQSFVRLRNDGTKLYFGQCVGPNAAGEDDEIGFFLTGYVEDGRHLTPL